MQEHKIRHGTTEMIITVSYCKTLYQNSEIQEPNETELRNIFLNNVTLQ